MLFTWSRKVPATYICIWLYVYFLSCCPTIRSLGTGHQELPRVRVVNLNSNGSLAIRSLCLFIRCVENSLSYIYMQSILYHICTDIYIYILNKYDIYLELKICISKWQIAVSNTNKHKFYSVAHDYLWFGVHWAWDQGFLGGVLLPKSALEIWVLDATVGSNASGCVDG